MAQLTITELSKI